MNVRAGKVTGKIWDGSGFLGIIHWYQDPSHRLADVKSKTRSLHFNCFTSFLQLAALTFRLGAGKEGRTWRTDTSYGITWSTRGTLHCTSRDFLARSNYTASPTPQIGKSMWECKEQSTDCSLSLFHMRVHTRTHTWTYRHMCTCIHIQTCHLVCFIHFFPFLYKLKLILVNKIIMSLRATRTQDDWLSSELQAVLNIMFKKLWHCVDILIPFGEYATNLIFVADPECPPGCTTSTSAPSTTGGTAHPLEQSPKQTLSHFNYWNLLNYGFKSSVYLQQTRPPPTHQQSSALSK